MELIVKNLAQADRRFSAIFWGLSGTGKTLFASTARRPLLYLQWDIEGCASVTDTDGVFVVNMAEYDTDIMEQFRDGSTSIYKLLAKAIKEHGIRTVVSDSVTTYTKRALDHACDIGSAYARGREKVTDYSPGWTGYRIRTHLLHQYFLHMGMLTSRLGVDNIFIGHEDQPKEIGDEDKRQILYTTMRLGGDNAFEVPADVRECWHFSTRQQEQGGKLEYVISLRPFPVRPGLTALVRPMKSTIFDTSKVSTIVWEKEIDRLETWINKWIDSKRQLHGEDL